MKLGILGTGKIVQTLMGRYRQLPVEKTYILATERSRRRAEGFGLDGVFTDYEALLNTDIDTVYVALPNDLHYGFTKRALEEGKHVILEKPATSNLRELEDLYALAEEKGCVLIEAVTLHHLPVFARLKEKLPKIGQVKLANLQFCQYSSRYADFLEGKIHPVFDPKKSGGALYDLNVYNLHAALALFGVPKTVSYEANVCRGIDTSGVLTLGYSDKQVVCVAAKDCGGPDVSVILGENGCIRIDEPLSRLTGFTLTENGAPAQSFQTQDTDRMFTEFESILRILDSKDANRLAQLKEMSLAAAKIMEQARKQAGIRFACDE